MCHVPSANSCSSSSHIFPFSIDMFSFFQTVKRRKHVVSGGKQKEKKEKERSSRPRPFFQGKRVKRCLAELLFSLIFCAPPISERAMSAMAVLYSVCHFHGGWAWNRRKSAPVSDQIRKKWHVFFLKLLIDFLSKYQKIRWLFQLTHCFILFLEKFKKIFWNEKFYDFSIFFLVVFFIWSNFLNLVFRYSYINSNSKSRKLVFISFLAIF